MHVSVAHNSNLYAQTQKNRPNCLLFRQNANTEEKNAPNKMILSPGGAEADGRTVCRFYVTVAGAN